MLNYTRIPAPRVTLVDPQTGIVANEWFRFFNNLYTIAYSSTGSVTPGTYGSAIAVPQITVDAFGGITGLVDVPIAIDASQIVSGTIASARISGAYTGITGVGTLTVGTWNASTIGVGFGGTGQTSYTDGQLLIGNSTGNTLTKATITAGTAIGISNGAGAITITNTLPDQTVVLANGTGISVTGTYPNFTITNTAPSSGGTVTSVAALTLGTSGTDLSSTVANGTTTPVITLNVPTASAANRGALSAADWTTFNSKAPGVTFTTSYIPYGQGTTTLNQSSFLQFDGTNLGIGGAPALPFDIQYASSQTRIYSTTATNPAYTQYRVGSNITYIGSDSSSGAAFGVNYASVVWNAGANPIVLGTNSAERMRVHSTGGVSIGNITDPGATNLSVTGNVSFATISSSLSGVISAATSGTAYTVYATTQYTCYQVFAFLYNNGANFTAVASFINDGTFLTRYNYGFGAFLSITVSGTNIQVTQTSGGPNDIVYKVIKIA